MRAKNVRSQQTANHFYCCAKARGNKMKIHLGVSTRVLLRILRVRLDHHHRDRLKNTAILRVIKIIIFCTSACAARQLPKSRSYTRKYVFRTKWSYPLNIVHVLLGKKQFSSNNFISRAICVEHSNTLEPWRIFHPTLFPSYSYLQASIVEKYSKMENFLHFNLLVFPWSIAGTSPKLFYIFQ